MESKAFNVFLTNNCNFNCTYCYEEHKKDYMSDEVLEKSLISIIGSDCKKVSINLFGGEPLLAKNSIIKAVEILERINKDMFVELIIVTNGSIFDEEVMKRISDLGDDYYDVSITVSIDGDEETHNSCRQDYNKVMDTIKKYKELFEKDGYKNFTLSTNSVISKNNLKNLFNNIIHHIDNDIFFHFNLANDNFDMEDAKILYYELEKLRCLISENKDHFDKIFVNSGIARSLYSTGSSRSECYAKTGVGAIDVNGDLYPCHRFVGDKKFITGNIVSGYRNDDLIKEICDKSKVSNSKCGDCKSIGCSSCVWLNNFYTGDLSKQENMSCMLKKIYTRTIVEILEDNNGN